MKTLAMAGALALLAAAAAGQASAQPPAAPAGPPPGRPMGPPPPPARGPSLDVALDLAQGGGRGLQGQGLQRLGRGHRLRRSSQGRAGRRRGVRHDPGHRPAQGQHALTFKKPSAAVGEDAKADKALADRIAADQTLITWAGGLPLSVDGQVIGAVGVSGAPGGEKDEACATAGLAKVAGRLR
ncbi:MAG: heme-binding protein [Caulobacteraceae bacterium]